MNIQEIKNTENEIGTGYKERYEMKCRNFAKCGNTKIYSQLKKGLMPLCYDCKLARVRERYKKK